MPEVTETKSLGGTRAIAWASHGLGNRTDFAAGVVAASVASLLINSGRTLYEVQHILGHTQVKTTQRYAHLSQDTLLAAANAATVAVGAVMLPVNSHISLTT